MRKRGREWNDENEIILLIYGILFNPLVSTIKEQLLYGNGRSLVEYGLSSDAMMVSSHFFNSCLS